MKAPIRGRASSMASPATAATAATVLFLFSCISTALPANNIQKAAEVLYDARYFSMGLTLDLIFGTDIIPPSTSLTVFSPRDSAFSRSGQPSLSLLQFHFSDLSLSPQFLRSLPFGTEIPTILEDRSLIVTTLPDDTRVSLNGIHITTTPIYSDGSLVIFGADDFFNLTFLLPVPIQSHRKPNLQCTSSLKNSRKSGFKFKSDNLFDRASNELRSSGYSVMASILRMQLLGFESPSNLLTIFAPIDSSFQKHVQRFQEYPLVFLQHTVPCRLLWGDLTDIEKEGVGIPTYRKGFRIHVTRSNDKKLLVNKVSIIRSELFKNEWIVIHGVSDLLRLPNQPTFDGDTQPHLPGNQNNAAVANNTKATMIAILAIFVYCF